MSKINRLIVIIAAMAFTLSSCNLNGKKTLYDFEAVAQDGNPIALETYKGKVVLIVNTASKCGFTPQYSQLQSLYDKFNSRGFEIIDFPCNQFGRQSPENDSETTKFCQLNYGTKFPQFKQIEVNGENEEPLYTWLKSEKGFQGFDKKHPSAAKLDERLSAQNPNYASDSDIKWNFTKFLIDQNGNVVARFEPTTDIVLIEEKIKELL